MRELVANSKTQLVVDELLAYQLYISRADLRNEVLLFAGEWQNYNHGSRSLTLSADRIDLQRRQLSLQLLQLLDRLEKEVPDSPPFSETLQIKVKSNKGSENLHFSAGEEARLYFLVNRPCKLRIIYQLANHRYVLLDNDRSIFIGDANSWIEIGDGFTVEAPFGTEVLHVFAQEDDFPPILTERDADGYEIVVDGLPKPLIKRGAIRGLKKIMQRASKSLTLHTHA